MWTINLTAAVIAVLTQTVHIAYKIAPVCNKYFSSLDRTYFYVLIIRRTAGERSGAAITLYQRCNNVAMIDIISLTATATLLQRTERSVAMWTCEIAADIDDNYSKLLSTSIPSTCSCSQRNNNYCQNRAPSDYWLTDRYDSTLYGLSAASIDRPG